MSSSRKRPAEGASEAAADLTEAEWAIMRVVWAQQPCAAGTVQETLQKSRGWAYSTVKTTMDRMVAKGSLCMQRVRNLNLFTANISEPQAKRGELRKVLHRAFGGSLVPMLRFMVESEELSEQELLDLREAVAKARGLKR